MSILLDIFAQTPSTAPQAFNWSVILVSVISSGALLSTLNWLYNRRKDKADVGKTEAEVAEVIQRVSAALVIQQEEQYKKVIAYHEGENKKLMTTVQSLEGQVTRLGHQVGRIPQLERDIMELTEGVKLLTLQLRENNITPIYPPLPHS